MTKYLYTYTDALLWRHLEFRPIELASLAAISATGFSISASSGTIVGSSFTALPLNDSGTFHAFIGSPTGAVPPAWTFAPPRNVPKAGGTSGRGINDKGDLVGWWRTPTGAIHPYVWLNGAAAPASFDVPTAVFPNDNTIHNAALDINNAGIVVGQYAKPDTSATGFHHAGFIANAPPAAAAFAEVDAHLLGATNVVLRGINGWGDVVGRYDLGNNKALGLASTDAAGGYAMCQQVMVPGADQTVVGGVNDLRQIVGYFVVGTQQHGFIWSVDATGMPIGSHVQVDYPGPTTTATRLDHIDNNGLMIGTVFTGTTFMPFVCWYAYVNFLESLLGFAHMATIQRVSGTVAGDGPGWVAPFLGWPHPVPAPTPYRESGLEAMKALALRELAGTLGDEATRKSIQKILHDYATQQVRGI